MENNRLNKLPNDTLHIILSYVSIKDIYNFSKIVYINWKNLFVSHYGNLYKLITKIKDKFSFELDDQMELCYRNSKIMKMPPYLEENDMITFLRGKVDKRLVKLVTKYDNIFVNILYYVIIYKTNFVLFDIVDKLIKEGVRETLALDWVYNILYNIEIIDLMNKSSYDDHNLSLMNSIGILEPSDYINLVLLNYHKLDNQLNIIIDNLSRNYFAHYISKKSLKILKEHNNRDVVLQK